MPQTSTIVTPEQAIQQMTDALAELRTQPVVRQWTEVRNSTQNVITPQVSQSFQTLTNAYTALTNSLFEAASSR